MKSFLLAIALFLVPAMASADCRVVRSATKKSKEFVTTISCTIEGQLVDLLLIRQHLAAVKIQNKDSGSLITVHEDDLILNVEAWSWAIIRLQNIIHEQGKVIQKLQKSCRKHCFTTKDKK